jgi:hypothetical protein
LKWRRARLSSFARRRFITKKIDHARPRGRHDLSGE